MKAQGLGAPNGSASRPGPEAAFEAWLVVALGHGPASLDEGVRRFTEAAAGSTYRQTKVALVQVLSLARARRPELVEAFFEALEPWLLAQAAAAPDPAAELRQIKARSLEVELSVPLPQDLLEQLAATQRRAVEALYAQMTATDHAEAQALRQRAVAGQLAARPVAGASKVKPAQVDDAHWGAFLGRLISHDTSKADDEALRLLVRKGRVDRTLIKGLELSGVLEQIPQGLDWIERVAAGVDLARRCRFGPPKDTTDRAALRTIKEGDLTPTLGYAPLRSLKDGDLEDLLMRWIGTSSPGLVAAMVDHHPHIPQPSQLQAVSAQLDQIAVEDGRLLEGFNVLTVMHQMGRSVPWLQLLHEKLGLAKDSYLGVSVPYSGSKVAELRLNREGFETIAEHDPRPDLLARLQETLGGGNPSGFDQLKEEDIRRAVARMLEKHSVNQKPIMIIDDGGYASKVIRKYFPEHEDKFRIVEWTTRGIRLFEELPDPKMVLISAAESSPKVDIEPAFIADSLVEHFQVALRDRFPDVAGKKILVVGAGNIGRACALAAEALGAQVTLNDQNPTRLQNAVAGTTITAEPDLARAVRGQNAVLPATGANSLPPELFALLDPNTVVTAASSVDIETRSPDAFANGHWSVDLSRLSVVIGANEGGPSRAPYSHPLNEGTAQALESALGELSAPYGLSARLERRDIAGGGFVLNLSRRARVMPIQREELILLNVTEAIAQCARTTKPGKSLMEPRREARVTELFGEHHPEELAFARRFATQNQPV